MQSISARSLECFSNASAHLKRKTERSVGVRRRQSLWKAALPAEIAERTVEVSPATMVVIVSPVAGFETTKVLLRSSDDLAKVESFGNESEDIVGNYIA